MKCLAWALFCAILILTIKKNTASSTRTKRYLVYPKNGSKLQLIFGTGVPIPLEHISATVGAIIKYTMPVPTNATQYTDPLSILHDDGMRKRSINFPKISRYDLYRIVEKRFLLAHLTGRDCLLRAICDVSRVPFKGFGLVAQLWDLFLSPSATNEETLFAGDIEYHKAEKLGQQGELSCHVYFPDCNLNLPDVLSIVV